MLDLMDGFILGLDGGFRFSTDELGIDWVDVM